jgi:hypothetical protein
MYNYSREDNIKKLIKYLLISLIVIAAARYIPEYTLPPGEILMIGATASIAFGVIDMVYPSIAVYDNKKICKL